MYLEHDCAVVEQSAVQLIEQSSKDELPLCDILLSAATWPNDPEQLSQRRTEDWRLQFNGDSRMSYMQCNSKWRDFKESRDGWFGRSNNGPKRRLEDDSWARTRTRTFLPSCSQPSPPVPASRLQVFGTGHVALASAALSCARWDLLYLRHHPILHHVYPVFIFVPIF